MGGRKLFLYSIGLKIMVIAFVITLIWGHRLVSQRWFDPIASTSDKISAVNAAGANIDERYRGRTGLMDAVSRADVGLVKAFVARGARIDLHALPFENDRNEYTPLQLAFACFGVNQARQTEIIKILLETARRKNIDIVNARDAHGNTAVHLVLFVMNDNTRIDILKLLLSYGGNINAQNSLGETLLHNTVHNNDRPWARTLFRDPVFKKVIDPNIKNKAGLNPKELAKKTYLGDMMKLICLESGCACTFKERDGQLD